MDPKTFSVTAELCGVIAIIFGLFTVIFYKKQNDKNKKLKIVLLSFMLILMIFDSMSYIFSGNTTTIGLIVLKISSFMVFFSNFIYISLFMTFLWNVVRENNEPTIKRVYISYALSVFGIIYLIVSQPLNLIYYYDEFNFYNRGKFWIISQIPPIICIVLSLSVFIQYRKRLRKNVFAAMWSYFILPALGTLGTILIYGYAFQNLSTVIATLFILVVETLNYREVIENYEKKELDNLKSIDVAYKQLSEYQEQVEKTLEGVETGIWSLEIKVGESPKLHCDHNMLKILGLKEGLSDTDCYYELVKRIFKEDIDKFNDYTNALIAGRSETIYRWMHPTLGLTYMRCGGWKDESFKEGILCRGFHSNVTETYENEIKHERELNEALRQAKEANQAKTDFLSTMSHDIRTPMNAIFGLTTIAKKHAVDPVVKDCIDKIEMSSMQLLGLVNDVLDMNKIESGKVVLEHVPVNIKNLLEDNASLIHEQAIENNITYKSKINVKHENVFGSPLHIKQILLNLVSNSIKYNKENGSINVSVSEKEVDETKSIFTFRVADTGLGMSEDFVKIIFEPFTQENGGARTKYKGTGLGMSIVKKLVDKMGGTIDVKSKLDIGTTITFKIPLDLDNDHVEVKEEDLSVEEIENRVKDIRVLLVEDNELNREIAKTLLEEHGIIIEEAEDGKIGLDKFVKSDFDYYQCILMDLRMPNMDGIEATKNIRALNRRDALSIPIIAMTADAFQEDVKRVKDAGMNEHLSKPLDIKKVLYTIAKLIK